MTAVASPGARMLMNAFHPRPRGIGPRGITAEALGGYLQDGWDLVKATPDTEIRLPRWIGDARPTWYQFERRA